MDKICLQGKCSIRNIQGQMVRISLQEEKQYLKYVITIGEHIWEKGPIGN